ncbi:dihydrolipoyl dehydrogenase family protein [Schleiferilactobacillus harbinensis]|jgi:glutathione reductase (NADPH)|uniref:dihydrolipoyl dehydrogenase family protein n=1 Tax=Schleiferilactobacillus harbinensis TaxID=304207 RepID=UPI00242C9CD5|nr:NAD(P)/FAD-dependent oxidoreductase [Schleiferilactobacillus harbinensis]MCI1687613.1 NAD(P)/FAD-dependent oxidoreductase [Schleiferilactobacillus harbinensis]MCI1784068.1 NAD(P)/FAD-dependent oxidoreductase [Schleiferilactobacillus harbinensis]MCI1849774.1 NAD(P)/FAD-dependent oxidoreductase [Schleiferilactobacillus harbinensis]
MSETQHFDTIVIGGGPGGLAVAFGLAEQQQVAVVESDLWGGTCPNRGCDPKKMLYGVVESRVQDRRYAQHGLTGAAEIDWPALMAFKHSYTDGVPSGTEKGLAGSGVTTIHGAAAFLDPHTIRVGDAEYTAEFIIIATGAHALKPDIPGGDLLGTSTDFLDLPLLPPTMAFIGGGYVAVELANIAANAGAQVHLIQHNHRLLRDFPETYTQRLAKIMAARGIIFHWDTTVEKVTETADGVALQLSDGQSLAVARAFSAIGRPANTDLNLAAVGLTAVKGGIAVNDHLQTIQPNIYAVGDVIAKNQPKLTPVASYEGRYVVGQILGQDTAAIQYPVVPHIVFASPELGQVGVRLGTTAQAPDRYTVEEQDLSGWYTYQRIQDKTARVTTITDKNTHRLVGAVVLAVDAEELLNYLTVLIQEQKPASVLQQWIPVYPSVASDLSYLYH